MRLGFKYLLMAAAVGLPATSISAQMDQAPAGEKLLTAVKDRDGAAALPIIDSGGRVVVNYRGYKGDTPLVVATRNRAADWVGFLLDKGADPNLGDSKGDTPLIIASRMGFDTAIDYLLERRAKVNLANRNGETPLIAAVQARQTAIVGKLMKLGADPDKADHAAGLSARDYAKRDVRTPELLKLIEGTKAVKSLDFSGPVLK